MQVYGTNRLLTINADNEVVRAVKNALLGNVQ